MSQPNSYAGVFAALKTVADVAATACETAGLTKPAVHTFRPRGQINLPAIYNVLEPSNMEPQDTAVDRDTLVIGVRVAVRHSDTGVEFDKLLALADVVRSTLDSRLKHADNPLGQLLARRTGVRIQADEFGAVPVLAIEFPIRVKLDVLNAPAYP